jgi:hypothetical protein
MEAQQQITVRGAPAEISSWVHALSHLVNGAWSRDISIERKVKPNGARIWPICLVWSGEGIHPRTALFLQYVSESAVAITSIVPVDRKNLAREDQQAALEAFRTALIAPRGEALKVTETCSSPRELREEISPQAWARLESFAQTANRAMPQDRLDVPRWHEFLIQLHRDGTRPSHEILERALRQRAFREEAIERLLADYGRAEDLLGRYDAFREAE